MNNKLMPLAIVLLVVLGGLYWVFGLPRVAEVEIPSSPEAIARGAYLFNAGGCLSCHQLEEEEGPTGGFEIESDFGTFYSPNITTDVETGIGDWTGKDFILAVKHGRSPGGGFYYPAFPYRSYAGMSDDEILDMAAYIMAQPAIASDEKEHDLPPWLFSWMMAGWNLMADFMEGEAPAVVGDSQIQRGAYLARNFSHCGECHTPRNAFGILQMPNEFAGSVIVTADITPEGLAGWAQGDMEYFLESGMTASFDFVGGEMMEVIDHTSQLTPEDRSALAAFLLKGNAAE